jgi:hypothetical protein
MESDGTLDDFVAHRTALGGWVASAAPHAREVAIAVGFLSPDGLALLLQAFALHLSGIERIRIVTGVLQSAETPRLVSGLRRRRLELAGQLEIRERRREEGLFHPKLYLLRTDKGWRATTGSSNLSAQAWEANIEADVVLSLEGDNVFVRTFEEWWREGRSVPPDEWPCSPTLEAYLNRAMTNGALVRIQTQLQRANAHLELPDREERGFKGKLL